MWTVANAVSSLPCPGYETNSSHAFFRKLLINLVASDNQDSTNLMIFQPGYIIKTSSGAFLYLGNSHSTNHDVAAEFNVSTLFYLLTKFILKH